MPRKIYVAPGGTTTTERPLWVKADLNVSNQCTSASPREADVARNRSRVRSTLIFVAILEVLSALGARTFLIGVAHEAERALKALTPWEVPLKLFAQVQRWYMPGSWTSALFSLLRDTFLHSGTAFVVTLIQVAIGVFVAFTILDEWGYAKSWYTPPLLVVLSLAMITVVAVPVFIIVYVVGETLGHIFPEASAAVYGSTLATGAITVTARTAEGGIHHAINHTLARLFMRAPH